MKTLEANLRFSKNPDPTGTVFKNILYYTNQRISNIFEDIGLKEFDIIHFFRAFYARCNTISI